MSDPPVTDNMFSNNSLHISVRTANVKPFEFTRSVVLYGCYVYPELSGGCVEDEAEGPDCAIHVNFRNLCVQWKLWNIILFFCFWCCSAFAKPVKQNYILLASINAEEIVDWLIGTRQDFVFRHKIWMWQRRYLVVVEATFWSQKSGYSRDVVKYSMRQYGAKRHMMQTWLLLHILPFPSDFWLNFLTR